MTRRGGLAAVLAWLLTGRTGVYLTSTPLVDLPDQVDLRPGHRVLDLGCGNGGLLQALAARTAFEHDPVGIDVSPCALSVAARRTDSSGQPAFVAAAASRLPFADASFHLVLAAYLFERLEDDLLFRVLAEAKRVIKPGGILLGWEFAPTSSPVLNRLHLQLLSLAGGRPRLRGFGMLAPYALTAGFKHIDRIQFRTPFLFPPIPRVVVMLQKARDAGDAV